jgi:myosin heavy subunit
MDTSLFFTLVIRYLIHIICFGALHIQEVEKYKLGNPKNFHYLNKSNCYELVGVSDAHEYLATRRAMDIVGISTQEQVAQTISICTWI